MTLLRKDPCGGKYVRIRNNFKALCVSAVGYFKLECLFLCFSVRLSCV